MFWIILTSTFLIDHQVNINTFVPRFARDKYFESVEVCRDTLIDMQKNDRLTENYVVKERGGDLILELRVSAEVLQTLRCVGN